MPVFNCIVFSGLDIYQITWLQNVVIAKIWIKSKKDKSKMDNTITITRKYTLIPTFSDTKEWTKKVMEYTRTSYIEKIKYYEEKIKKIKIDCLN